MTDPLDQGEGRQPAFDAVLGELKTFKKLRHLDDAEIAHRMVLAVPEVRKMRRLFGRGTTPLKDIGLNYRIRLLLGKASVKTLAQLLALTPEKLHAIEGIGPKRGKAIRMAVRSYLENSSE